ncbi:hypothetical protein NDU88_008364 [Pleurodeles waltl]|uniref:Uncharacterized protein n=1 Tax=Pleurodeles waltl TaxID=8319 RepID=A0AAV7RVV7_PLEWA|nr:hypothetical protein NDU88_008364 [Pleurodeles waltl]
MGTAGAPVRGPAKYFSVCKADTEIRNGCSCTRRTPATPPAPFGAGILVAGAFPLGRRALFWRPPAGPAEMCEWPQRSFDHGAFICRRDCGGRLPPPATVGISPLIC